MDGKKLTILILLDFSKAFDSLDHFTLFTKLKSLSFSNSSIHWFQAFLSDRTQAVSIPNQPLSSFLSLSLGVAQGSSISPLLFNCYINDLHKSVHHCSHHLCADDFQIYFSFPPSELQIAVTKIQEDLDRIRDWAILNKLELNTKKTQAIVIGAKSLLNSIHTFPTLILNDQPLSFSSSVKNLGITIDQTLSWKPHIAQLSRRTISSLKLFQSSRHLLTHSTRKLLISSIIFPHFDYCCVVYGGLSKGVDDRLKRIMNSSLRFVLGIPRRSHVSPRYNELKWLFPSIRRHYFLASFLFQVIKSQHPSYIYSLLQFKSSFQHHKTRSRLSDLYTHSHITSTFERSFLARSTKIWNSIPPLIRHSPSLSTFKLRLFQYFLDSQINADG